MSSIKKARDIKRDVKILALWFLGLIGRQEKSVLFTEGDLQLNHHTE